MNLKKLEGSNGKKDGMKKVGETTVVNYNNTEGEEDSIIINFYEPNGINAVFLEDDGNTGYGYLVQNNEIMCDVWLYNVGCNPESVNWKVKSNLPFCNPAKYCTEEMLPRISEDLKLRIECIWSNNFVTILLDGRPLAKLCPGDYPGWSRTAKLAGPLARPLLLEITSK